MPEMLTSAELDAFHEAGYHVARQLLAADEVAEIRETFMAQAAEGPVEGLSEASKAFAPDDPLARYPRMMHPHRHDDKAVGSLAMRHMLDERVAAVLRDLLGEEPIAAQSMFYFKPPGSRGQDLHQDNFYLRVHPGTCMAAWFAIDDADRDNGGMVVVPGSHKYDVQCPKASDRELFFTGDRVDPPAGTQETPVDLAAGDVLFFNGSIIHGSYPNESADRFRRAFICHYAPRSCEEISKWYFPLYELTGQTVVRAEATGGGPCGDTGDAVTGPH
ncbi:MAG: phytanoyl-CoA dioxygenase family protein [Phycisphaeraceae bacterium]